VSLTALAFVLASALYAGFQWTVRIVVYPQMAKVPPDAFVAYERNHQRLVSIAVGPLFAALGLSSLALLVHRPAGVAESVPVLAVVGVAMLLAVTAFAAVSLHSRLGAGFDDRAHRRLLVVDAVRVVVALACVVVGVVALTG
jgi:uncharacterized membrane protein